MDGWMDIIIFVIKNVNISYFFFWLFKLSSFLHCTEVAWTGFSHVCFLPPHLSYFLFSPKAIRVTAFCAAKPPHANNKNSFNCTHRSGDRLWREWWKWTDINMAASGRLYLSSETFVLSLTYCVFSCQLHDYIVLIEAFCVKVTQLILDFEHITNTVWNHSVL